MNEGSGCGNADEGMSCRGSACTGAEVKHIFPFSLGGLVILKLKCAPFPSVYFLLSLFFKEIWR